MRPGPLTVLGIVDHAVDTARRHPLFVLSTIGAGSLPLALAGAVGVHLVRTFGADATEALAGGAILALLTIPRAIGWGAGVIGLQGFLDEEPIPPAAAWGRALPRSPQLFAVHAGPLMWSLFGILATLGPLALAVLAADRSSFWASAGVALAACTAGSGVSIYAILYVSRRTLALPVAATSDLGSGASFRRSLELAKGQAIRVVSLQAYLAILQIIVWLTLVQAGPWGLDIAERLTGYSLVELQGILAWSDPTYLAFQAAMAFLIMDPVRCLCVGYLHQDGETRRSGADLKARLERVKPAAAAPLQAEEAGWRG